ncbi:OLC1v1037432C1 [Oldenlandia corymbosa var. corymbosa]|uniref:OLC1v1037432C1 n=1 Tax=Oldenlandia corymbosa var. corymbosa TaxID=529605 RepID=A0AAV1CXJ3_OLDCO|nr:OLC1v1037432C1 [Oldenlandia corymbosa var. corymbosa]
MASWLKAAEDLFEVVDRRAKLVASDKPDEQVNLLTSAPNGEVSAAPNGQGAPAKRTRPKSKNRKRVTSAETSVPVDAETKQAIPERPHVEAISAKTLDVSVTDNSGIAPQELSGTTVNEANEVADSIGSTGEIASSRSIVNGESKDEADTDTANNSRTEAVTSPEKNVSDTQEGTSSLPSRDIELAAGDPSIVSNQNTVLEDTISPVNIKHEGSEISNADAMAEADGQVNDDVKVESISDQPNISQPVAVISAAKVQEQLEEAQGLLKNAVSTGQTKEARLARVCAGLSSRLQEYKSENAQLEELLTAERELSKSYEQHIKQLQKDLSTSKSEVNRVESNMADALAAKNAELEALVSSLDATKRQAAVSEGNLASLQANMETIMRSRELTETRMMQALREELSAAERRAEDERAAHNATKMAAMEREVELEQRAIEASTALARIQRTADERATKAADLEQKVALLEVECASLSQELQDMEARARRGQKKPPEETNQVIQIQAWQEEVERARQGQRDAESRLSSTEAELQKMRVEMAAMKRDAEHYSRQEHIELEKRYRELTDLLYYKQTQLETMASEKAAAEFQLEKELKRRQDAQVEAERNRVPRRASSSWEEDTEMKALETLPLHHRHMAGASIQLQKAAKLIDSGAVRATKFLWRYPFARVFLLFYLVFVHLFLMYLLHRLQEQADTYSSRELAESMGLMNQTLP